MGEKSENYNLYINCGLIKRAYLSNFMGFLRFNAVCFYGRGLRISSGSGFLNDLWPIVTYFELFMYGIVDFWWCFSQSNRLKRWQWLAVVERWYLIIGLYRNSRND